jgi:hypothetical protein
LTSLERRPLANGRQSELFERRLYNEFYAVWMSSFRGILRRSFGALKIEAETCSRAVTTCVGGRQRQLPICDRSSRLWRKRVERRAKRLSWLLGTLLLRLCAGYERESTSILFDLSKAPDDVEKFHAKVERLKEDFGESVALAQGLKPGAVKPRPDSVPMDARRKVLQLQQEFSAIEAAMTVHVRYEEILRALHLQERFVDFLCERYEEELTRCTADLLSGRRPSGELRQKVELLLEELDRNVAAALDGDVDTSNWRNYWQLRKLMQDISSQGMDLGKQAEKRREPVDSQPSNLLGPAAAKRQPDVRAVAGRVGQKRPTFIYQTNDLIRMPGLPGRLECFSLPDKLWSDQQMSGAQIVVDAPNALLLLPKVVNRPDIGLSTTGSLAGLHVRLDYAQSAIALIIDDAFSKRGNHTQESER